MVLQFFSSRLQPIIPMVIDDYTTGRLYIFPMLFDTGADRTAFPASYAAIIGHDNKAQKVVTVNTGGVGGKSAAFLHSVRVGLLDPEKSSAHNLVRPWTSGLDKALFIEKLTTPTGLSGRKLMRERKRVTLLLVENRPDRKWEIDIAL